MIQGKVTDYGDLLHVEQWLVKGRRLNVVWRIGPQRDTTPADRTPGPAAPHTGKADVIMDLLADKSVTLSVEFTDEMGNPTDQPTDYSATYTVDDSSIINLTDNGDGTSRAAAVGTLGTASVHGVFTWQGQTVTGDLQINVVAGLAERANIVAGPPEETTPDNQSTPGTV